MMKSKFDLIKRCIMGLEKKIATILNTEHGKCQNRVMLSSSSDKVLEMGYGILGL